MIPRVCIIEKQFHPRKYGLICRILSIDSGSPGTMKITDVMLYKYQKLLLN
jgi:hypothetical protein